MWSFYPMEWNRVCKQQMECHPGSLSSGNVNSLWTISELFVEAWRNQRLTGDLGHGGSE